MNFDLYSWISILLVIIVFVIILYIGLRTDLLREKKGKNTNGKKHPYSFSRFQFWLWTLIITPCFLLYWGFTPNHEPTLNSTGLILLGISISVTFTSGVVSQAQDTSKNKSQSRKNDNDSIGFWTDLLMDDSNQFSVTRLQQLVFTGIYVVIYVTTFIKYKMIAFPIFDEQAFYLLGVSAGGYLFAKGIYK